MSEISACLTPWYSGRDQYDDTLLKNVFDSLPREYIEKTRTRNIEQHRNYVAMMRRRYYFECRDESWQQMLPYQHFDDFRSLVLKESDPTTKVRGLLQAINRRACP